jgi:hypothetical protein
MPRSHSNSPRPMTSSCVASVGLRNNGKAGRKFHSGIGADFMHGRTLCPWRRSFRAGCNSRPGRYIALASVIRRGGRVAEGARLESVYTGNRIVGSNPTPSAKSSHFTKDFAERCCLPTNKPTMRHPLQRSTRGREGQTCVSVKLISPCATCRALPAQLHRAPNYESGGQEFESLRARHNFNISREILGIG